MTVRLQLATILAPSGELAAFSSIVLVTSEPTVRDFATRDDRCSSRRYTNKETTLPSVFILNYTYAYDLYVAAINHIHHP
eukprot:scaffold54297_cov19-Prasinocladus_malaysianus.AAC.1